MSALIVVLWFILWNQARDGVNSRLILTLDLDFYIVFFRRSIKGICRGVMLASFTSYYWELVVLSKSRLLGGPVPYKTFRLIVKISHSLLPATFSNCCGAIGCQL